MLRFALPRRCSRSSPRSASIARPICWCICRCATRTRRASRRSSGPLAASRCRSRWSCTATSCSSGRGGRWWCGPVTARGDITLRFFSFYPSQQAALSVGSRIRAFGEVRGGFFGAEMVHPRFRKVADDEPLARGDDADLSVHRRTGQFGLAEADRQGAGDGRYVRNPARGAAPAPEAARPGAQPEIPAQPAARHRAGHPACAQPPGLAAGQVRRGAGPAVVAAPGLPGAPRAGGAGAAGARRPRRAGCSTACPSA